MLEVDPENTKLLLRSWIILSMIMQASVVCRFQVSNMAIFVEFDTFWGGNREN